MPLIFSVKIATPPYQFLVYLGMVHYTVFSWCWGNYCWLAIVSWFGYCEVSFHAFVLRHLVISPVPSTKTLPIIKCGTSHKRPPKMQFRGCLWEITHGNQTATGLFQEKSRHIFFLEENLLHLISKLWYEWFQFVNESSLYTFSGVVYSMNKEQVRGQTIRQVVNYKKLKTMKRVVFYERFNFITELWLRKFWCFESNKGWSQGCSTVLLNRGFLFFHIKIQLQQ